MRTLILLVFAITFITSNAQHLKIKNYGVGYRTFETESVGNNPLTIAPFLRNPWAYQDYINNNVQYNGLYGHPGVQILRNYSFSMDWYKDSTDSRFWKKHTIQTGLFVSNHLRKDNMALENQKFITTSSDTTLFRDTYSLVQKQQFLGVSAGINKRIRISNALVFLSGFQLQGSIAFLHRYQQQWDSSTYNKQTWTTKTTKLPNLKGKNFFQWQMIIPLSLELNAYKHQIFLRGELDFGITGDKYRTSWVQKETDGFSFWLIYQPGH